MMIANFAPLMMQRNILRGLPSGMDTFGYGFILTNVVWNFVGGVIAGGLFALIYNKIADTAAARSDNQVSSP